jgi:ABC-2 type transport system permease protein
MQTFLTLVRREMGAYFVSLTGYIIIAVSLFLMGFSFFILVRNLQGSSLTIPLTELFYLSLFFWIIVLVSTPMMTMRLFSLEQYSGTFETLMTAPVSDLQVVLAKFFAALLFYVIMWVPLTFFIFILRQFIKDPIATSAGTLGTTMTGILLVGCLYVAIGCFTSSITKSQVIAGMLSLAAGFALLMIGFLADHIPAGPHWMSDLLSYVSIKDHMHDFSRGVMDSRQVVFYLSTTIFFLFMTHRVVESRRWK